MNCPKHSELSPADESCGLRVAFLGCTLLSDTNKRHSLKWVPFSFSLRVCYMHDDTPKVVAMAVNTVMAMCRILCQIVFVSIVFWGF
jgi:hypothetical protein